jgi:hypothetical protein
MYQITKKEYYSKSKDYRGIWGTYTHPEWEGKRTLMVNENGGCVLLIEGLSLEIVD